VRVLLLKGVIVLVVLTAAASLRAGDWPQWRGPLRNGVASDSPALLDKFPKNGPKRLWVTKSLMDEDTERFSAGGVSDPGGWGSVSVVGKRAWVSVNMNVARPTVGRQIDLQRFRSFQQLVWRPNMSQALLDKIETARTSDFRRQLKDDTAVRRWVNAWVKDHMKEESQQDRHFAYERLLAGPDELHIDAMRRLLPIADRTFPDQPALNRWFDENGIDAETRKKLDERGYLQTKVRTGRDLVWCLDTDTGKPVWTRAFDGAHMAYSCSFTPAVTGGRVYVLTSAAVMVSLDADTGKVLWQSESLGKPTHAHNRSSSALVAGDVVVVGTDTGCHALDVKTGELKWSNADTGDKEASAVARTTGGRTQILSIGKHQVHALDAATGKVLWSVPKKDEVYPDWRGEFRSTPALVGNVMAFCGGQKVGLTAYAFGEGKPKKLWQVPMLDAYASPIIHGGHVYYIGGSRATCVELSSGRIAWQERLSGGDARLSSPVLADGKLFAVAAPWLYVIKADPTEYRLLARVKLDLTKWTSPSIADGKLYLRIGKSVACYDLRKP